MKKPLNIAVIYNSPKNKNSKKIAKKIHNHFKNCEVFNSLQDPDLSFFDFIFFIIPNVGDEEIPLEMENYLCSIETINKKYFLCELGNFFGFEYKGCKGIVIQILNKLNWQLISEISIDSVPKIDIKKVNKWIEHSARL
jgi:flavodoxin